MPNRGRPVRTSLQQKHRLPQLDWFVQVPVFRRLRERGCLQLHGYVQLEEPFLFVMTALKRRKTLCLVFLPSVSFVRGHSSVM